MNKEEQKEKVNEINEIAEYVLTLSDEEFEKYCSDLMTVSGGGLSGLVAMLRQHRNLHRPTAD